MANFGKQTTSYLPYYWYSLIELIEKYVSAYALGLAAT